MADHPAAAVRAGHTEPVPRRVRALRAGRTVLDTTAARYLWEWPGYPQFLIPLADIEPAVRAELAGAGALRVPQDGYARIDWTALDAWFEEDEEIFVHPRNPYTRVDALRSSRHVEVSVGGTLLASTDAPVLLFETGLPTRYYIPPTDVRFEHLTPSDTRTQCPYKGVTSGYWSFRDTEDIAWVYHFPLPACAAIAGLVAFYNEKVDLVVDGVALEKRQA